MPVLSFPCVITYVKGPSAPSRRRIWIKGHDLYALAVAATDELGATPADCEYALFSPDASSGVFLVAAHANASALVGPMGGPSLPSTLSPIRCYPLHELLAHVGLAREGRATRRVRDASGICDRYVVIIKDCGIWDHLEYLPVRRPHERDDQFDARCASIERMRIERVRHEGIHVVCYHVPPSAWTAHDLEHLMVLAYRLLPTSEPRWRESGALTQERFAGPSDSREPVLAHCLQIARGDYVAYLRLPAFPARAVTDWVSHRHVSITLHRPVMNASPLHV